MKNFISFLMCSVILIAAVSCKKRDDHYKLYDVKVQLVYSDADPVAGVTVNAVNVNTGMIYVGTTDNGGGNAVVPAVSGLYEFSATETRASEYCLFIQRIQTTGCHYS